jgi:hypothetical protein
LGKHLAHSRQIGYSALMQVGVRLRKCVHDPAQVGGMVNEFGQERGAADPLVDDARATTHLNHFPDSRRWGSRIVDGAREFSLMPGDVRTPPWTE